MGPLHLLPRDPGSLLEARARRVLPPRTVQLWAFGSARAAPDAARLRERCHAWLDRAEQERAARFVFDEHRHDYIVFHGVLRAVLARYLDRAPEAIAFTVSAEGKPSTPGLGFNLSHSADRALLAVTAGEPVGADLEMERPDVDVLGIASRYFFGAEHEAVRAAAADGVAAGRASFFRHWVAKEAVLKGAGHGLGFPLERFGVHFAAGRGRAEVSTLDAARVAPDWQLRMLEVGEGCPGAVAVRGADWCFEVAGD